MMATLRGTVFTVCDLVFHPTPHRCSTQLACLCVRLYHHGNSSGRRPQAVVDAINVQAHRKSKRMDAKIQYSDVISQLNDILRGGQTGLTARDSLGSRLGTLESLGCSMSDVQEYPQILRLTETEVIKRAQRLKRLGVDPITVETLRVARFKLDKTVAKKLQLSDSGIVQKIIKPKITVARSFGKLLQCTPEECQTMQVRNPSFTLSKNHPVIEKKVRLLQEYGVTSDLIDRNPSIFRKSLKTLQTRLSEISSGLKVKTLTQMHIDYVLMGKKEFQEAVKLDEKLQCKKRTAPPEDSQHKPTKLKEIAALLDVKVCEISDIKLTHTISLEYARRKINYLLGLGVEKRDIVNHFYFLNNSVNKMESAVEMAREAGIQKPSLILLVNILQHKCIPRQRSHARQLYTVAVLLDVPNHEILSKPSLHFLGCASRLSLKKNFLFLMDNGFSKEDILKCPLVLGHDPQVLMSCFDSLPDRLDSEVYEQIQADKGKMVNLLQYYIELDTNFNCKDLISAAGRESDCSTEFTEPAECMDILVHDD